MHYCKEQCDASKNAMSNALFSKEKKAGPTSTISAPILTSTMPPSLLNQTETPSTSTHWDLACSRNVTSQQTYVFALLNLRDQVKTLLPGPVFHAPVSRIKPCELLGIPKQMPSWILIHIPTINAPEMQTATVYQILKQAKRIMCFSR